MPLLSKTSMEVLSGGQELYARLRRYGYPVENWCANRGLVKTMSCPDERQQYGRAEAAIASIKSRVRRLLHSSGMATSWWPVAARHVVELERRRVEKIDEKLPRFGEKVVTRKRAWKRGGEFEQTSEECAYLTLCLKCPKGMQSWTKMSYLIKDCVEPVVEAAVRVELHEYDPADNPAALRRRLREKTTVEINAGDHDDPEIRDRVRVIQALLEEDEAASLHEPKEIPAIMKGLNSLRKEQVASLERSEEDGVLQTVIVSSEEALQNRADWIAAIEAEINSLVHKGAIRRLTREESTYYLRERKGHVQVVPGKGVFSKKAPKGKKNADWLRKSRTRRACWWRSSQRSLCRRCR